MSAPAEVPELVSSTLDLSRQRGFITSIRNETGRLLASLAASRTGTLAELGTGCGVGSAWLSSGAPKDARVVSAELDPALAGDVQKIFATTDNVDVIAGDWSTLEQYAPFSLLFVDVREVMESIDVIADLLEPGASQSSTTSSRPRSGPHRRGARRHRARAVAHRRPIRRRGDADRRRRLIDHRHPPLAGIRPRPLPTFGSGGLEVVTPQDV